MCFPKNLRLIKLVVLRDFQASVTPPAIPTQNGNVLDGTADADGLAGNEAQGFEDNTINGHGGNDTITAGTGNDSIEGGTGADSIDGGTGEDTAFLIRGPTTMWLFLWQRASAVTATRQAIL